MKKLHISDHPVNLSLPLDTVTQAIGVLAKRRAGKSFLSRRIVEQLFRAGQQVAIVDPKGDWWGIRSAADGKSPGLPVIIIGGEHGDVPLEVGSGEVVAKLVVEERVSALLDLSLLRKHEVATFMTAFLENLYRLKAREEFRTPLMLAIDEADAIAPQKPQKGEERMLGAAEDIVRRGGQRGIGCMLVSQRSAVLNKNVLTQVQILVALRTIAPQDLAALDAWIDVHGTEEERKTLMESLPSLPVGDAWFWSPGWPTTEGIFERVHVLPIETFDSGATPKPGEKRKEPKQVADVDLDALKKQMADTVERAKEADPREWKKRELALQKTIRDLQAQVARPAPAAKEKAIDPEKVKATAQKMADRSVAKALRPIRDALRRSEKLINDSHLALAAAGEFILKQIDATQEMEKAGAPVEFDSVVRVSFAPPPVRKTTENIPHSIPTRNPQPGKEIGVNSGNGSDLPPAKQRILNALAFLEGIGLASADRGQLALLSKQSPTSSGYANNLGSLRTSGYIDYPGQGRVALTPEGRALASTEDVPQSSEELHQELQRILPPAKWRIVEKLIEAHPEAMDRNTLAEASGQSSTSSGYANNLGSLRTLGVIDYPRQGEVIAAPVLFLEGQ